VAHVPGALADYVVCLDKSGHDAPESVCPDMRGPFQAGLGFAFSDFTDGLSNTLLVGEKQIPEGQHGVGWWDCSTYNGDYYKCSGRPASKESPPTTDPRNTDWRFGSRHDRVVLFCFADGHVANLPVTIDPQIFEWLGGRSDGMVTPSY